MFLEENTKDYFPWDNEGSIKQKTKSTSQKGKDCQILCQNKDKYEKSEKTNYKLGEYI